MIPKIPPIFTEIEKIMEPFVKAQKIFEFANEAFENYKKGLCNLKLLVPRGWYVSVSVLDNIELNTLSELSDITSEQNVVHLEQHIINDFEVRAENIFERLKKDYPQRAFLFEEIQKLLKHEFYSSLVILSYAQSDGMCRDVFGHGFFDTDKSDITLKEFPLKIGTHKCLNTIDYINGIIQSKRNEVTNQQNKIDSKHHYKSINRHLVMHGYSKEFGNRTNAIRAILLMEFIADLKMHLDEHNTPKQN